LNIIENFLDRARYDSRGRRLNLHLICVDDKIGYVVNNTFKCLFVWEIENYYSHLLFKVNKDDAILFFKEDFRSIINGWDLIKSYIRLAASSGKPFQGYDNRPGAFCALARSEYAINNLELYLEKLFNNHSETIKYLAIRLLFLNKSFNPSDRIVKKFNLEYHQLEILKESPFLHEFMSVILDEPKKFIELYGI
jgi:hypothetical protein